MIVYYTYQQKTKVFAHALSDILNLELFELNTDLAKRPHFNFMFKAMRLAFARKSYPVVNMPPVQGDVIYVVSPVWGGFISPPVKYFLLNANLSGKTVHVVLTASMPSEKQKRAALEFLNAIDCIAGEVHVFLTSGKFMPERDVLAGQLSTIFKTEAE